MSSPIEPARYEITASVTTTEPDPDTSDNTDTFRFEVVAAPGGGGGGGGGGVASASASAAKVSPAKPKAGTDRVGERARERRRHARPADRVACAATIGAAKLKGSAKGRQRNGDLRFPHAEGREGQDAPRLGLVHGARRAVSEALRRELG